MRRSHIDRTAAQLGIANGRRQARCTASQGFWRSDKPQTDGFGPLLTLGYVDGDTLAFRQAHDAGTFQRRGVHEDILSALIRSDKAEALIGVVPLHRAQFFDGAAVARRICRSLRPRTSRRLLRRGAGIHADDLGHLRPLRSWAGAHLKRRARRYAAVAASLSHGYMQEGIAGAIRELHEAEPLLGIVPLDGGADGWTGRCFELRPARWSKSEISSRRFVVVVVETTAAVRAIPVSVVHGCFLRELWVAISWVRFKSREFRD